MPLPLTDLLIPWLSPSPVTLPLLKTVIIALRTDKVIDQDGSKLVSVSGHAVTRILYQVTGMLE